MGGRHTVVNPETGRRVFKTGKLGRQIAADQEKKPKSAPRNYHCPCSTKRPAALVKKCTNGSTRPSARAMFDAGFRGGTVCYDGKCHVMAFRQNGSPYWKPV